MSTSSWPSVSKEDNAAKHSDIIEVVRDTMASRRSSTGKEIIKTVVIEKQHNRLVVHPRRKRSSGESHRPRIPPHPDESQNRSPEAIIGHIEDTVEKIQSGEIERAEPTDKRDPHSERHRRSIEHNR